MITTLRGDAADGQARNADADRLTVLHVLAPAPIGGLERVVRLLAVEQARAGLGVHVAAVVTPGEVDHAFVRAAGGDGIRVETIVVGARAYVREYRLVRELCRRLRPDVVHTHGFRPDVVDAAAARSAGIATVATTHGFIGTTRRGRLYEWLQRGALRYADAVVAVSAPQVELLVSSGVPRKRIHLVPNAATGTAALLPRAEARARLGIGPSDVVAGWVGRLGLEKGPDVLVDAAARIRDAGVRISIVGDGGLRPELEARAAAIGVADAITWHGAVDDAAALFAAFDVFLLSSRTEGTPIVLFEAMAAGVPIVATAVGGVPDVLSEGEALLVPPSDPAALAAAILRALGDPDASAARVARARARLDRYAVGPWVREHIRIYESAMLRAGSGRGLHAGGSAPGIA